MRADRIAWEVDAAPVLMSRSVVPLGGTALAPVARQAAAAFVPGPSLSDFHTIAAVRGYGTNYGHDYGG